MVFDLVLKHCVYIFLLTSSAQVLKFLNVLLTSLDMEREAVSKIKIKGRLEKFEFRREDLNALNRPRFDFIKMYSRPPSGGSFTA